MLNVIHLGSVKREMCISVFAVWWFLSKTVERVLYFLIFRKT